LDIKFTKTLYLKDNIIKNKRYSTAKYITSKLIIENFDKKYIIEVENFIISSCNYSYILDYFNALGINNIIQKEKFETYALFA